MRQVVEIYKDYLIYFEHISYNCPSLSLYGYAHLSNLKRAMTKKINARAKQWREHGNSTPEPGKTV